MARTASALHILVKHKEQAEDIIAKLKKGAKFDVLAKRYSTCPSGKKGGSLGEFGKGDMVGPFDKVCRRTIYPAFSKDQIWLACRKSPL